MGVYMSTSLDSIYKNLFDNAKRSANRKKTHIGHGIKLIVFGCFLLEAQSNAILENILMLETININFSSNVWEILKKTNVMRKLEIICCSGSKEHFLKFQSLKGSVEHVFNLRNRLAHYKNDKQQLAENISHEDAKRILYEFPIPELSLQLSWPNTSKYAKTITETHALIKQVNKIVCKNNGVKITSKI